jgi:hypothetical protein
MAIKLGNNIILKARYNRITTYRYLIRNDSTKKYIIVIDLENDSEIFKASSTYKNYLHAIKNYKPYNIKDEIVYVETFKDRTSSAFTTKSIIISIKDKKISKIKDIYNYIDKYKLNVNVKFEMIGYVLICILHPESEDLIPNRIEIDLLNNINWYFHNNKLKNKSRILEDLFL